MTKIVVPSSPRHFTFEVKHAALLIIDMQNDFCATGGYMDYAGPTWRRCVSRSQASGASSIRRAKSACM